ncbi:MAG TPA: hypothetical protein VFS55_16565 [Dokdonella sp.]|nr:hypothetical protein [Dokdonella sp.]
MFGTASLFFACALSATVGPATLAVVTISGPSGSVAFGSSAYVLPNGNIVVSDPRFTLPDGTPNVGAVYLYRPDGGLISTLRGSSPNSYVGSSVVVLASGNFVVSSPAWGTPSSLYRGAVTFGRADAGVSGVVDDRNSLVGTSAGDSVGRVIELANGHYVVASPNWDSGATTDAGAVTWGDGETGIAGAVGPSNSLVGTHDGDRVGEVVVRLDDGNYVVASSTWDSASATDVGAVTWVDGARMRAGAVDETNSLVGARPGDAVGERISANRNGHYAVASPHWDSDVAADAGAATICRGAGGCNGSVSSINSLVGSHPGDQVGIAGIAVLANGNYVVRSPMWGDGDTRLLGAATWAGDAAGLAGEVSAANSLIGSAFGDQVSSNGVLALANGNYTVSSQFWHNGPVAYAGAVTFGDGARGTIGVVDATNSLVGASEGDALTFDAALANGNYVVYCSHCDMDGVADAGAVVLGDGNRGTAGVLHSGMGIAGTRAGDEVGTSVDTLPNGNFLVHSPYWNARAGAVTFVDGRTGMVGTVDESNSLVGSRPLDSVGASGARVLSNGNYIVVAPDWSDGSETAVGALTWGDGNVGVRGRISPATSFVGAHAGDRIGSGQFLALPEGDFVVGSPQWRRNDVPVGAATYLSGAGPIAGTIDAANSLLGTEREDAVGSKILAVAGLGYLVWAPEKDVTAASGVVVDAGAVVPGSVHGDIDADVAIVGRLEGGGPRMSIRSGANLLVIGRPADNEVSVVDVHPVADRIFEDGFDGPVPQRR